MTKDEEIPLTTTERVTRVRATTTDLIQIKPAHDAVKQRQSEAKSHCKAAKVRDKFRTVAAGIAELDEGKRDEALAELAIALHAHDLPLVLTLPVDPQLELFGKKDNTTSARHNATAPVEQTGSSSPEAVRFDDAAPSSAANLDDDDLDFAGFKHNSGADQHDLNEFDESINAPHPQPKPRRSRRTLIQTLMPLDGTAGHA